MTYIVSWNYIEHKFIESRVATLKEKSLNALLNNKNVVIISINELEESEGAKK